MFLDMRLGEAVSVPLVVASLAVNAADSLVVVDGGNENISAIQNCPGLYPPSGSDDVFYIDGGAEGAVADCVRKKLAEVDLACELKLHPSAPNIWIPDLGDQVLSRTVICTEVVAPVVEDTSTVEQTKKELRWVEKDKLKVKRFAEEAASRQQELEQSLTNLACDRAEQFLPHSTAGAMPPRVRSDAVGVCSFVIPTNDGSFIMSSWYADGKDRFPVRRDVCDSKYASCTSSSVGGRVEVSCGCITEKEWRRLGRYGR